MQNNLNFDYDPFDRQFAIDPFPYYEEMRKDAPVHYWEKSDFWTICTYDACREALWKPKELSSRAVAEILLGKMPGSNPDDPKLAITPTRAQLNGHLVSADPPVHTELRNIANRSFLPNIINPLKPYAEAAIKEFIANMRMKPNFDFVQEFGSKLPPLMICRLLGIADKHRDNMRKWTDDTTAAMNGSKRALGYEKSGIIEAGKNIRNVMKETIAERIENPGDDLISTLLQKHEEGALTKSEMATYAGLLLFAGSETTTHLMGSSIYSLLKHPQYIDEIIENPKLIKKLFDETLRWNSLVQYVFRKAVTNVEIAGVTIPKGANVVILLGSANRDPKKWGEDAHEFKLHRKSVGHFGWGFGTHVCIGRPLALMESTIAMEHIVPMLKNELANTNEEFNIIDSMQFRGYNELYFEWKDKEALRKAAKEGGCPFHSEI